jgi:hypothetical protein
MALSTCRWKDTAAFRRPKGIFLHSKQVEGGGDGGFLRVLWVDKELMIPLPLVNL